MSSRGKRDKHPTARPPLSDWAIRRYVVFVLGIAVASGTMMWYLYGGASPRVQLDAIRTASAITVVVGGAVALLLVGRRQQSAEQTLAHQREVAQATERDAAEQRITELYTRAVDQLGAKDAPVRLGGLHALERVAQSNPTQRQTMADVICAYLRMPYTLPDDPAPGEDAPEDAHNRYEQRRQELQVRLTAQRILTAHLNPDAAEVYWADIDLNLTEAHLHQLDLSACRLRNAQFNGATFTGNDALFCGAEFAGYAEFRGAEFTGHAVFDGATFVESAMFDGATFAGGYAGFSGTTFAGYAWFRGTTFATWEAEFGEATFAREAEFGEATFTGTARFGGATFTGNTQFGGARVFPPRRVVLPRGWITRAAQPAEREEDGWLYVVRDERIRAEQPAEAPDDDGEGGERWGDEIMTRRSKGSLAASDTGRANGTLATRA